MSAEQDQFEVQFSNVDVDWTEVWRRLGRDPAFIDACPEVATAVMDYLEHDMGARKEGLEFVSVRGGNLFVHIWVEYEGGVVDTEEYKKFFKDLYGSGVTDREFMKEYQSRQKCGLHEELVAGKVRRYL